MGVRKSGLSANAAKVLILGRGSCPHIFRALEKGPRVGFRSCAHLQSLVASVADKNNHKAPAVRHGAAASVPLQRVSRVYMGEMRFVAPTPRGPQSSATARTRGVSAHLRFHVRAAWSEIVISHGGKRRRVPRNGRAGHGSHELWCCQHLGKAKARSEPQRPARGRLGPATNRVVCRGGPATASSSSALSLSSFA